MLGALLGYKLNPTEGSAILGRPSLLEGLDSVLLLSASVETLSAHIQKLCLPAV
jgi:hypothetical protein